MKARAAFLAVTLAALPAAAGAQERSWTDFRAAGAPPSVPLPRTSGVPAGRPGTPAQAAPAAEPGPSATPPGANPSSRPPAPKAVPGTAATPPARPSSAYAAGMSISGVAKAVDGHTLHVSGHAVRLHGVEAPGLSQHCRTRSGTTWPCGRKSAERLAQLAGGQRVTCVVEEPSGEGAAAICTARGISDLGMIMAREGWTIPNGHAGTRYSGAAQAAKASGAGLWSGTFQAPWEYRRGR